MTKHPHTKLIHEGHYAAEVEAELIDTDEGWSPYLSQPFRGIKLSLHVG